MSSNAAYKPRILKEGLLEKKSRVLKKWRKRYFKLNGEVLCFFKEQDKTKETRPMGRIFLADIVSVGQYFSKAKAKDNCFSLDTKSGKTHILNCASKEESDAWIMMVNFAKDEFFKQEESDPIRRRSIKLHGDLKRIKLFKDPIKGIGVRIKSVNGCVFVTRIVEDGPVAETGVLRPGDQILDVDGVKVCNMSIQEVSDVLKVAPILMTCTVKPANHFRYCQDENGQKQSSYAEIDIDALAATTVEPDTEGNYEDDQSSAGSDEYVIPIPAEEEHNDSEDLYEVPSPLKTPQQEHKHGEEETYMNLPNSQNAGAQEKTPIPAGNRNYLELYFEDS